MICPKCNMNGRVIKMNRIIIESKTKDAYGFPQNQEVVLECPYCGYRNENKS